MKGHIMKRAHRGVHSELQWHRRDLRSRAPEWTTNQRWRLRRTIRDGGSHSERILRIREPDATLDQSVECVAVQVLKGSSSAGNVIELGKFNQRQARDR